MRPNPKGNATVPLAQLPAWTMPVTSKSSDYFQTFDLIGIFCSRAAYSTTCRGRIDVRFSNARPGQNGIRTVAAGAFESAPFAIEPVRARASQGSKMGISEVNRASRTIRRLEDPTKWGGPSV